ncbi:MAG: glucoamylase family protein [Ginsengibacter sp.]
MKKYYVFISVILFLACNKSQSPDSIPSIPSAFQANSVKIDDKASNSLPFVDVAFKPQIKVAFSAPVNQKSVDGNISMQGGNSPVPYMVSYENNDSIIVIQPSILLQPLTKYSLTVSGALQSKEKTLLSPAVSISFNTSIDSTDKFSRIADDALLELIQKQTFRYFNDFAHPVSGMARERNASGDVVTTGGTGFGVMSIIAAANRNFISRNDGLNHIQKIVTFLSTKCTAYHGAFAHWVNGSTGTTVPFSANDNGADLVETSYLMQGLLCARQYFRNNTPEEIKLRDDINTLWDAVEWNWFRQNNQDVLYWHWSPDKQWLMNVQIKGWNEALIVYALAASSNTNAFDADVYNAGWASKGAMLNGNTYYGIKLPLGPTLGGPLFFAHYSFLGLNPNGLSDQYGNYFTQNVAHSKINYSYCVANPKGFYGYSDSCWGLTASDEQGGYSAHEPNNDNGTISPTAAISSLPYTPVESMKALKFFYYTLGDKLWKEYGFIDAFNLQKLWFADSFLAIDQGPMIVMIENYRSKLLWNLFMSCPEIKRGLKSLQFQGPSL